MLRYSTRFRRRTVTRPGSGFAGSMANTSYLIQRSSVACSAAERRGLRSAGMRPARVFSSTRTHSSGFRICGSVPAGRRPPCPCRSRRRGTRSSASRGWERWRSGRSGPRTSRQQRSGNDQGERHHQREHYASRVYSTPAWASRLQLENAAHCPVFAVRGHGHFRCPTYARRPPPRQKRPKSFIDVARVTHLAGRTHATQTPG